MTEYKPFPLYRDAVKFFESLDRELWKSAFLYKCSYSKCKDGYGYFIDDKVEYKKHYTEIKKNGKILSTMAQGLKFL